MPGTCAGRHELADPRVGAGLPLVATGEVAWSHDHEGRLHGRGVGAPPRLPPDGVDQAPDHVRPHVLELDPANSSSLPDDGDACGLHRVMAGQVSQQSRHRNPRIPPIIARRPRASRSADLRSPGSRHHSAPARAGARCGTKGVRSPGGSDSSWSSGAVATGCVPG